MKGGALSGPETDVEKLITKLEQLGSKTKTLFKMASQESARRVINSGVIKPGDAVFFAGADHKHKHSTLYLGSQQIAMHTYLNHERVPDSEKIQDPVLKKLDNWERSAGSTHPLMTIIHFTRGTDFLPGSGALGWWVVQRGASIVFDYFFDSSGVVVAYSRATAAQKKNPLARPEQKGHWFQSSGSLTVVWSVDNGKTSGDIEQFGPISGGKMKGKQNGSEDLIGNKS